MTTLHMSQSSAIAENHPDVEYGDYIAALDVASPVSLTYDTVRDGNGDIVLSLDSHGLWAAPDGRLYSDVTMMET